MTEGSLIRSGFDTRVVANLHDLGILTLEPLNLECLGSMGSNHLRPSISHSMGTVLDVKILGFLFGLKQSGRGTCRSNES